MAVSNYSNCSSKFNLVAVMVSVAFITHRNRVTGVYELSLCHLSDAGSPGETSLVTC